MEQKPYVVAIAGGTCSGKSTLTDRLAEHFSPLCRVKVLHMDSYFKKEPPTTIAPITRKEYVEHDSSRIPWNCPGCMGIFKRRRLRERPGIWCLLKGYLPCIWIPFGSGQT